MVLMTWEWLWVQVCCSSPERFLRMGRGGVLEAKPIKGTAPRSKDPEMDATSAAELAGALHCACCRGGGCAA